MEHLCGGFLVNPSVVPPLSSERLQVSPLFRVYWTHFTGQEHDSMVRFTAAQDPMGPLRRAWFVFLHDILRKFASLVRVVDSGFRLCLSFHETLEVFSCGNQQCSVAENQSTQGAN